MANISISLEGIDQAIANLNYKAGSIKSKAVMAIRSCYTSEESIKNLNSIGTDALIRSIWEVEDDPLLIKAKRRNFSSIKSSINADLESLSQNSLNPENIIITESNIFDMTEEAKSHLLNSFSDAVKTGDINLDQATHLLKAVAEFLENIQVEKKDTDPEDIVSQIKKILDKITKNVLSEEGPESDPEQKALSDVDEAEEILEDVEEIELDEDESLEEVEDLEDDIEEIELEEDQEIEDVEEIEEIEDDIDTIELDEDEEIEEVSLEDDETPEEAGDLPGDVEEIELGEDEILEEVEEFEDDIEEIELDEDQEIENIEEIEEAAEEEVEEIELDEDQEIEDIEDDIDAIELDEDEEIEEVALEDDETLEEIDELDEDELKALEEYRQKKELAEHFDETLGDREKKFNKYTTVPEGKYTVGTQKSLKSSLELQEFSMPKVYIGIYPVTNALFEIFIEETGYITTAEQKGFGRVYHSRFKKNEKGSTWKKSAGSEDVKGAFWHQPTGPGSTLHGKRNHPVIQVSVHDALAYASWIGRRLPTEAEWEAAARSDLGYTYPWGDEFNIKALNIEQSGFSDTCAVDEYDAFANEFKIVDMLGNVMEWTSDVEPSPFPSGKDVLYCIAKGAAWNSKNDITLGSRGLFKPGFTSNTIGFRCISEIFI